MYIDSWLQLSDPILSNNTPNNKTLYNTRDQYTCSGTTQCRRVVLGLEEPLFLPLLFRFPTMQSPLKATPLLLFCCTVAVNDVSQSTSSVDNGKDGKPTWGKPLPLEKYADEKAGWGELLILFMLVVSCNDLGDASHDNEGSVSSQRSPPLVSNVVLLGDEDALASFNLA